MTTTHQRLPRRRDDVELRGEGSESWLVAKATDATHQLNPTARAIWELCDGTTTVDELVGAICQVFDVDRRTAASDVEMVIEGLTAADLVSWSDGEQDPDLHLPS